MTSTTTDYFGLELLFKKIPRIAECVYSSQLHILVSNLGSFDVPHWYCRNPFPIIVDYFFLDSSNLSNQPIPIGAQTV